MTIKIKRITFILIILLIFISNICRSQDFRYRISLRIGEPIGFSVQLPIQKNILEFGIGKSIVKDDDRVHWFIENQCQDIPPFATAFEYLDHRSTSRLNLNSAYRKTIRIKDIKGLQIDLGIGFNIGYRKYVYNFRYILKNETNWTYSEDKKKYDFDFGPQFIFGMSYNFKKSPFFVFAEVNPFIELYDVFMLGWAQGAIGLRYEIK